MFTTDAERSDCKEEVLRHGETAPYSSEEIWR